jgi:phosphatidylserine/phosphatidylglycerophosphate/cardiolipin synthase-like enzyme
VDEAHAIAPSGRGRYATDSLRTLAIRTLAPHAEHKLFLTATPHNGYRESFTALLELLDSQRFAVLEDAEIGQGKVAFDALAAFGPEVAQHAGVYVWPMDQRPAGPAGQRGSLHAKCAVADASQLLISSANLTEHAFNLNIELGVLIRGGELPRRADSYWTSLIRTRALLKVGA